MQRKHVECCLQGIQGKAREITIGNKFNAEKIKYDIMALTKVLYYLYAKIQFIEHFIGGISPTKYSKTELTEIAIGFCGTEGEEWVEEFSSKLIKLPVYDFTTDYVSSLRTEYETLNKEHDRLMTLDPVKEYIRKLEEI